jgi:hypothetical protein
MGTASRIDAKTANHGGASTCSRNEAGLQTNSIVMRVVQAFWPLKCKDNLRFHTRASDRMIQYWLANKYSLDAGDLANLLRSDAGFQILESLMGDAKPQWWAGFKRGVKRAELRRRQAQLAKEIEDNEQAELDV